MGSSSDISELAASLATVAIAGLSGGAVGAGAAALTRVVAFGRSKYDANAQTRDLRHQLTAAIEVWADSERVASPDDVKQGHFDAVRMVEGHGLDAGAFADRDFDAIKAADEIVRAAKSHAAAQAARTGGQVWVGEEPHHAVARRAIQETYAVLLKQYTAQEPLLLPVLRALRTDIDTWLAAVLAHVETHVEQVVVGLQDLVAAGSSADVMTYLRVRVRDWDQPDWLPGRRFPSLLERRLWARPSLEGGRSARTEKVLSADEALLGARMLVVLGGPGSGKTWLARRYARLAAQTALSELEDGAEVADVEIPLFTTWELWRRESGARQGLVAASFASGLGHSDLGGQEIVDRLVRGFTRSDSRILAVVDSLDEAADRQDQTRRLNELDSVSGWRFVVTSRPGAWGDTYKGGPGPRIMELLDLAYPEDVRGFIESWFVGEPLQSQVLMKQIKQRPELRRSAVVPLLLTFYCILSDEPEAAGRLPAQRRELYRRLVRRLLLGRWTPGAQGPDTRPDLEACEALLRRWAWDAVKDDNTPTKLGDWRDTFTPTTSAPLEAARAIDHVTPKVAVTDEGVVTRRFVHRTLLEHFVAEYIARLNPGEAAEILLPHFWGLDSDWGVAAPAAISAHHSGDPGVLLGMLLDKLNPDDASRMKSRQFTGCWSRSLRSPAQDHGVPAAQR